MAVGSRMFGSSYSETGLIDGNDLKGSFCLDVTIAELKHVRLCSDAYRRHEGGEVRQDKPCPMSCVGRGSIPDQNRTQSDRDAFGELRYAHWKSRHVKWYNTDSLGV